MNAIDRPATKRIIWQELRDDLIKLIPSFAENELLLCPTCSRAVPFDEFSLEHIIPRQALACDPQDVRESIPHNERSGLTLLCRRPLVLNGKRINGNGCNSWKGKHYDNHLRELLDPTFNITNMTGRHHIALFAAGYLGLFRRYKYPIALSQTGLLMRNQFFEPRNWLKTTPINSQILLRGDPITDYSPETHAYWSDPFKITIDGLLAYIAFRNMSFILPLSRDPNIPYAKNLPYAPPKHKWRPDLTTVFE